MTHVRANVTVTGHDALLVGRLWDVNPATGRQRLVDRGVVRLRSRKLVSFDLNGNAYKFARGHQIKLELLGRDSPTYRAANGTFSVTVNAAAGGAADAREAQGLSVSPRRRAPRDRRSGPGRRTAAARRRAACAAAAAGPWGPSPATRWRTRCRSAAA